MSREWKEVRLGDVALIKGGKRLPKGTSLIKEQNLHPYIKVKDMNGGKYVRLNKNFEFVDLETHKKIARYTVSEGDLIISIVGTIGLISKVHKSLNGANLTENCVKIIELKNVDTDYLYYFLISKDGQNEIMKGTIGSTQPKLPIYNIKKIKLPIPPLEEQKAIAHILSSLDEKIEVNNQINKKLEEMAQTIFKHWFVDFEFPNENGEPYKSSGGEMVDSELGMIPKGWEVRTLEDSCNEIIRGFTSKYVEISKIKNLNQKVNKGEFLEKQYFKYLREDIEIPENKYVKKYDVLLNSLGQGTLGRIHFYIEDESNIVVDQHLTIIRANSLVAKDSYIYQTLISDIYKNILDSLVSGSTGMLMLNISKVREVKIALPLICLQDNYDKLAKSLYRQKEILIQQNEYLSNIRDILLPKLMSGEIRVPLDN